MSTSSTEYAFKPGSSLLTIFRLLRELPHAGQALFWLILASFLCNIFSLAVPLYFMQVYDRLIVFDSRDTLLWLSIAIIVILILNGIVSVIRGRLAGRYALQFSLNREEKLMKEIFSIPEDEYFPGRVSELDDKFRSLVQLQNVYAGSFFQSILDLPFTLLFLGAAYYLGGILVYWMLAVLVLYMIIQGIFRIFIIRAETKVHKSIVDRLSFLREFLEQIHVIKAQSMEESMLRRLEMTQEELSYSGRNWEVLKVAGRFFGDFLTQVLIYGTIVLGGFLVLKGDMTIGAVTATTMLARRIAGPVQSFNQFSLRLMQARKEMENLKVETAGRKVDMRRQQLRHSISGSLEIAGLTCRNAKGEILLNDLNMHALKGDIIGIQCQDTRAAEILREVLLGVRKPDEGQVIVDSFFLSEIPGLYETSQIAILPRKGVLFTGTILENITYFNPNLHIQALDAASLIGLDHAVAALPKGYETEMRLFSNNIISAGILQRIAVARALVHRPRILISDRCDELMDQETLEQFMDILKRLQSTTTIVLVSSRPELMSLSTRSYRLSKGELILREVQNV